MVNGLRWIVNAYELGYTLVLCEDITPQELLVRMGAEPQHIHELSEDAAMELLLREEDDHPSDLEFLDREDEDLESRLSEAGFLSCPESIVRAGAVPGWAYAIEQSSARSTARLGALSRGTRAYSAYRSVNAEHEVGYARDGRVVAYLQDVRHPDDIGVDEGVPDFAYGGEEPLDVAFLRFLERKHGICIAWEETLAPLPTAAFARTYE